MKKRRFPWNKLYDKKGSLLIISYLVIFVLLALGAAFIAMSVNESRIAERQRRTTLVFHIAEAGIERAIYDLRQDFITDASSPSWADGNINGLAIGPNTASFYSTGYNSTSLNGGSYAVQLKNVSGITDAIWVRSTGTLGDVQQTIEVYAKIVNLSPWNNAIFAGAGASGAMVNGNVNIRGSVHILGSGIQSTDLVVDLGGTAEIIGNNYKDLAASLKAKIPALPTTTVNGETVETLSAVLRVKRGIVGLSGSATAGEANVTGNAYKETIDAAYVTDGYAGSQGATNVHSDNGTNSAYDLGDTVTFPSLNCGGTYCDGYYTSATGFNSDAVVINSNVSITPTTNIAQVTSGSNSFQVVNGNIIISGKVYIKGTLTMSGTGNVTYNGTGTILTSGNVQINTNLVTNGNNSFPANILGIMTPDTIDFDKANIDVMGLFYGEAKVKAEKQTDIVGTIVSNYFDFPQVPSIFQVPDVINHLPAGLLGQSASWVMKIVSWQKL